MRMRDLQQREREHKAQDLRRAIIGLPAKDAPYVPTGELHRRRAERRGPVPIWPEVRHLLRLPWHFPDFPILHRPYDREVD